MKRDLDLVRKILLTMESHKMTYIPDSYQLRIDGYVKEQIEYHMKIMAQADFLHIDTIESPAGSQLPPDYKITSVFYSISWYGHEFLSASRDNKRWAKVKEVIQKVGDIAYPVIIKMLIEDGSQAATKLLSK